MLKQPGLISSDLHLSVIQCNYRTYDDNIGQKLKKPSFVILRAQIIDGPNNGIGRGLKK